MVSYEVARTVLVHVHAHKVLHLVLGRAKVMEKIGGDYPYKVDGGRVQAKAATPTLNTPKKRTPLSPLQDTSNQKKRSVAGEEKRSVTQEKTVCTSVCTLHAFDVQSHIIKIILHLESHCIY